MHLAFIFLFVQQKKQEYSAGVHFISSKLAACHTHSITLVIQHRMLIIVHYYDVLFLIYRLTLLFCSTYSEDLLIVIL